MTISMTGRLTATIAAAFAAVLAVTAPQARAADGLDVAIFAGGCFWCVESDFDAVPGVVETVSGYTGGHLKDPTYRDVGAGGSGHYEAVRITFDPKKVSYAALLDVLWHSIDPTDPGGQFCDRGESYRTAIFANSPEQKRLALESKKKLEDAGLPGAPIVTPVLDAGPFYVAEDYHQNYYKVSPVRYKFYRLRCGRDARIRELWGDDAFRGIAKH